MTTDSKAVYAEKHVRARLYDALQACSCLRIGADAVAQFTVDVVERCKFYSLISSRNFQIQPRLPLKFK